MRRSCLLLALSFALFSSFAFANDRPVELVVVDASEAESPLEITGTVSLKETVAANEFVASLEQNIAIKNISNKTIRLLVAEVDVTGYHCNGQFRFSSDDFEFFAQQGLNSQESFLLPYGTLRIGGFINPLNGVREPRAEFRLLYAQFDDGSTFGKPEEAKEDLTRHATIVNLLRKLAETYSVKGAQAFQRQLEDQSSSQNPDLRFDWLREIAREQGVEGAIAQVRKLIAAADANETAFRLNGR